MGTFNRIYYNTFMFPFEKLLLGRLRKKLICRATGSTLEIGFGTGVNLKYYDFDKIDSLIMMDRNPEYSIADLDNSKIKVIEADAMKLPFDDNSFDSVVFTLVFCSVDEPDRGLAEIKRVLKDNGTLIFIEHVLPEGNLSKKLVNGANSTWKSISHGCNINRETTLSIRDAGFSIDDSDISRNGVFVSGLAKKRRL